MPEDKSQKEKTSRALETSQKVLGIMSYLSVLAVVPYLFRRGDKFVQFHARQGVILFLLEMATWILVVIPILGWLANFILWIIWAVLSLLGIFGVWRGRKYRLPFIYQLAKKIK